MRQVWVDADACPRSVLHFLRSSQTKLGFSLITVASSNHLLEGENHIMVEAEPQATDLAIANRVQAGDIVVTQDWGLAAIVLGKQALAIAPSGQVYATERMPFMLEQRNIFARHRRSGGRTKGPAARTADDDQRFRQAFVRLLAS